MWYVGKRKQYQIKNFFQSISDRKDKDILQINQLRISNGKSCSK